MQLALVIDSLGIGGAEKVLVKLAHHLADLNHKIYFINFFQETGFSYQLNTEHKNIVLINLGEKKITPNNTSLYDKIIKIIKRIFLLSKLFIKLKPDIILSFLVGANISCLLANICSNIPIIVAERIDPSKHEINFLYKLIRILSYRLASAIIVQTNCIKTYFPEFLQHKIFIIPNWITKPTNKKTFNNNQVLQPINNIISIGRLTAQKNHQLLIKAFAKLSNQYPNLRLHIYGEGELKAQLQNLIIAFNLQHRINLPGITMDVEAALIAADLFVFPSIYEGFPNALCEAMSVGLPVISSNCSGANEIIKPGYNGLLFNINNLEELIRYMDQLISDPLYAQKLATNAQQIINTFDELNILGSWEQALERVLPANNNYDNISPLGRDGREA